VEEFADEIEQEQLEIAERRKLLESFPGYQEEIDGFLKKGAYSELLEYFQTEKMMILSKLENHAAIMWIIVSIYQMETEEGIEEGIFSGISDMKSAEEHYLKVKFLMWRLEFLDENAGLSEVIDRHPISVPFLKYLVHTSSFDKANTAYKLAMLLKEKRRWGQAFAMLNYVNDLIPDEEIVFCEMADICMETGQYQMAGSCIEKIKKSSEILANYRKKWRI